MLTYLDVSGLPLIPSFSPSNTVYGVDTGNYGNAGFHMKAAATETITLEANCDTYTSTTKLGVSDINERIDLEDGDSTYTITVEDDETGEATSYTLNVLNADGASTASAPTTDSDKLRTQACSTQVGTLYFQPYPFSPATYEYTLGTFTNDRDVTLNAVCGDSQSTVEWYYPYDEDGVEAARYENGDVIRFLNGDTEGEVRVTKLLAKVIQPDGSDGQSYLFTINKTKPLSPARLTSLAIGSLTLDPAFDGDVTEYTATTSNATNTLTAAVDTTVQDGGSPAQIRLSLNGTELDTSQSGTLSRQLTWEDGENTVLVRTLWLGQYIWNSYTITVTKE